MLRERRQRQALCRVPSPGTCGVRHKTATRRGRSSGGPCSFAGFRRGRVRPCVGRRQHKHAVGQLFDFSQTVRYRERLPRAPQVAYDIEEVVRSSCSESEDVGSSMIKSRRGTQGFRNFNELLLGDGERADDSLRRDIEADHFEVFSRLAVHQRAVEEAGATPTRGQGKCWPQCLGCRPG